MDCFCIAFYRRTIQNYPIKAVKIGIVPSLAYLQEIVLALKGFRQNKDCLGHRSKIKYRIRLSQYRKSNRFGKILKKHRFNYAQLSRNHTIISSRN
jgi:hypothetical protein